MSKQKSISRQKLNTVIKRLPKPVQEHSKRCKMLASYLLDRLRADEWFMDAGYNADDIASAVFYHDIGKVRIPKDNLYVEHCKTVNDRDIYRSHVDEGILLTEKAVEVKLSDYKENSFESYLLQAITQHHERLDGTGFPERIKDEDISFAGRVAALVDAFDNLMFVGAAENYDFDKAVLTLIDMSGKKLDKKLVELFVHDVDTLRDYVDYVCGTEKNRRKNDSYGIHIKYLPVKNLTEGVTVAYNAKLILNDPYYGDVTEEIFTPVADRTGQVFKLQKMALDRLAKDIRAMKDSGIHMPRVWFTISARQFEKKKFFIELEKIFAKYGMDLTSVGLGVSEADIFASEHNWKEIINEFRKRGMMFSIEDFGNKSSLLTSMDDFTPDRIAFSRELAKKSAENVKTADVVEGMVTIARKLDVSTTFDGVDDKKTEAALHHMGVRYVSGEKYGLPITVKELIEAEMR